MAGRLSLAALSCFLLCLRQDGISLVEAQVAPPPPPPPSPPTCTAPGSFEIYDGTCQNYYMCIDNGEGLQLVMMRCSPSAIFVPELHKCAMTADACTQTTATEMTTTATTAPETCVRAGRFQIHDANCKMYYMCYWNGIGYSKLEYLSCPDTLAFDPVRERCMPPEQYTCQ